MATRQLVDAIPRSHCFETIDSWSSINARYVLWPLPARLRRGRVTMHTGGGTAILWHDKKAEEGQQESRTDNKFAESPSQITSRTLLFHRPTSARPSRNHGNRQGWQQELQQRMYSPEYNLLNVRDTC